MKHMLMLTLAAVILFNAGLLYAAEAQKVTLAECVEKCNELDSVARQACIADCE